MSDERIEIERHSQAEAEAAASEHRPVADPPDKAGSPMVPSETDSRDLSTHVQRINPEQVSQVVTDANGRQWLVDKEGKLAPLAGGPVHRVVSYAAEGHPEGVRWPYTLTMAAVVDHVLREAGSQVWLLPHEVAAYHRLVDRALFKALGVQDNQTPVPPKPMPGPLIEVTERRDEAGQPIMDLSRDRSDKKAK